MKSNPHRYNVLSNRNGCSGIVTFASSLALGSQLCLADTNIESTAETKEHSWAIEEVIVTANKREESLHDVSVSISAATTADIELQGLDGLEDFMRLQPGVNLTEPVKNRSVINIRGLATQVHGNGGTQDTASVYINDMPVTDTFGAVVQPDLRLYDVERVEILRGPQGTLFGSGSLGGTVRVITRKPQLDSFDASARIDLANTEKADHLRERYDFMVNLPLVEDTLAVRGVGYYREDPGWVENINLGTDNSSRDWGGRLAILWQASDELKVSAEVMHQDSEPDDSGMWNPSLGEFEKSSVIAEGRPLKLTISNMAFEYNFEDVATLVSSTSYYESKTTFAADFGDQLGLNGFLPDPASLPPGFVGVEPTTTVAYHHPWEAEFLSQELRLVSDSTSDIEWQAGVFYIEREVKKHATVAMPGYAAIVRFLLNPAWFPDDELFLASDIETQSQELAVFGEVSYRWNESWKATLGLRLSDTEVEYFESGESMSKVAVLDFEKYPFLVDAKTDQTATTGRLILSYEPTDELHFYGSISKGYRIGQVNERAGMDGGGVLPPIPDEYDPDESFNYELGAKAILWDGKLQLNAAIYLIDWSDVQFEFLRAADFTTFVANSGDALSKGAEIEVLVLPLENLEVSFGVTLQEAEVESISAADSVLTGVNEGDQLPGSVDYKLSGAVQYNWSMTGGYEAYARVAASYTDKSPNNFTGIPGAGFIDSPLFDYNEAYGYVDASVGIIMDQWEITLYGENLTDDDSHIVDMGGLLGPNSVTTLRPLTFGVRAHYRY